MRPPALTAVLTVLAVLALSPAAAAQTAPEPTRRTPTSPHAFAIATGTALTILTGLRLELTPNPPVARAEPGGPGRNSFDEGFRSAISLGSLDSMERARRISDMFLVGTMLGVAAIDTIITPLVQDDPDLVWQASFAHVLALGITMSIGDLVKHAFDRPRPFTRECAADPQRPGCADPDTHQSFYSLHTGMAFTSAGFSCAMHLTRTLYDDPVADGAACGGAIAMAATTGLLRILADRHYLTDVLVGGALGFLVGYLIPLAMVPERRTPRAEDEPEPTIAGWGVAPLIAPAAATSSSGTAPLGIGTFGVSVFGAF